MSELPPPMERKDEPKKDSGCTCALKSCKLHAASCKLHATSCNVKEGTRLLRLDARDVVLEPLDAARLLLGRDGGAHLRLLLLRHAQLERGLPALCNL